MSNRYNKNIHIIIKNIMLSIYIFFKKRGKSIGIEGAKKLEKDLKEFINLNSLTLNIR
jgi:hypothetical protein